MSLRYRLANWLASAKIRTAYASERLGRSAVVFAPHPDDEALGCGGSIIRKTDVGARVAVVVMTDGSTSHRHMMSSEELVQIRAGETRRACDAMGLPSDALFLLNFPDQALAEHRDAAVAAVAEVLRIERPEEIFIPHAADPLTDHCVTNEIVRTALKGYGQDVVLLEYPVWLWHAWPWTKTLWPAGRRGRVESARRTLAAMVRLVLGCRVALDISAAVERKRAVLSMYTSQMVRPEGTRDWPILADVCDGEFLRCFLGEAEIFRQTRLK